MYGSVVHSKIRAMYTFRVIHDIKSLVQEAQTVVYCCSFGFGCWFFPLSSFLFLPIFTGTIWVVCIIETLTTTFHNCINWDCPPTFTIGISPLGVQASPRFIFIWKPDLSMKTQFLRKFIYELATFYVHSYLAWIVPSSFLFKLWNSARLNANPIFFVIKL